MSDFAKYPWEKQVWLECSVCGLDYPMSLMTRHYKTRKFVDRKCADNFGRTDLLAEWDHRPESPNVSPQRVDTESGGVPPGQVIEPGGGYGGGGYGEGGYGEHK